MAERARAERPSRVAVGIAAVIAAVLALPLVALAVRAPWSELPSILAEPGVRDALRLSLIVSAWALLLSVLLGLPLAWAIARVSFPGRRVVRAVLTLPMVMPPVIAGIGLLVAFGRRGLVGQHLDRWFGISLPFSTAGAVVAATFVSLPFFVLPVEAGLRSVDHRVEEAARTLRGSRWRVFTQVTLPLLRPSLLAGGVLAWARALGEFGATVTFAGSFPGRTQTVPLAAYLALETDPETAIVLSLVLVAISVVVLAGLRDRWLGA
jgi:molybdate transport system permease protein